MVTFKKAESLHSIARIERADVDRNLWAFLSRLCLWCWYYINNLGYSINGWATHAVGCIASTIFNCIPLYASATTTRATNNIFSADNDPASGFQAGSSTLRYSRITTRHRVYSKVPYLCCIVPVPTVNKNTLNCPSAL